MLHFGQDDEIVLMPIARTSDKSKAILQNVQWFDRDGKKRKGPGLRSLIAGGDRTGKILIVAAKKDDLTASLTQQNMRDGKAAWFLVSREGKKILEIAKIDGGVGLPICSPNFKQLQIGLC